MYRVSRAASGRYTANRIKRWAQPFTKRQLVQAARALWPMVATLAFAGVAHAQGTMDFSGAQTLMGTFKAHQGIDIVANQSSMDKATYQIVATTAVLSCMHASTALRRPDTATPS